MQLFLSGHHRPAEGAAGGRRLVGVQHFDQAHEGGGLHDVQRERVVSEQLHDASVHLRPRGAALCRRLAAAQGARPLRAQRRLLAPEAAPVFPAGRAGLDALLELGGVRRVLPPDVRLQVVEAVHLPLDGDVFGSAHDAAEAQDPGVALVPGREDKVVLQVGPGVPGLPTLVLSRRCRPFLPGPNESAATFHNDK